jgi:hypothetical protein
MSKMRKNRTLAVRKQKPGMSNRFKPAKRLISIHGMPASGSKRAFVLLHGLNELQRA